ncbi:ABC transporter substrate-binding protein [Phyllobacterium zundukense]|uniref:ABC transporter substrate-binding protein n=1 Tax=Phyllobacterium zundukense TaxID=1867719 RepID=A0ACD4CV93_9HYPH|nr:ABC transporter substrate-binding protein [Phyllobacterium zundukense]UXN57520.1 ABC transporter substrate-binding protein [Phyllobacterium zundukense]
MISQKPSKSLTRRQVLSASAAGTLAFGIGKYAKAANPTQLTILYTDPALVKHIHEQIAAAFVEKNPGTQVKFNIVPTYDEALAQSLRDGMTGNAPDIAFHGLNNVGLLARRGLLADLDPLISAEHSWEALGYSEGLKDIGRADGKVWGLPFALSTLICYYNDDLVRQAGQAAGTFPSDWSGIVDLASKINASSGGMHFQYQATGNVFLFDLMCSMGTRILSEDRKEVLFDSPEGLRALQVLKKIGQSRGGNDLGSPAARQAFAAGTLGILVDSSSGLTNYLKQAGDRFSIATAAIPLPAGNHASLPSAGNAATIMTKDLEKQKLAWEYVKFASNPESQTILAKNSAYVPVNSKALTDPHLLGNYYKEKPQYETAASMLPYLTGWEAFPGPNSLRIDKEIQEQARAVLTLQREPEEALAAMAKTVRDLIAAG